MVLIIVLFEAYSRINCTDTSHFFKLKYYKIIISYKNKNNNNYNNHTII